MRIEAPISKLYLSAPLIANPPLANFTTTHGRLARQDRYVCLDKISAFSNKTTVTFDQMVQLKFFRIRNVLKLWYIVNIRMFFWYLLPARPWPTPNGGGSGEGGVHTNRRTSQPLNWIGQFRDNQPWDIARMCMHHSIKTMQLSPPILSHLWDKISIIFFSLNN